MKPDIKCSFCGEMIHWLEVFPDDFCLSCHSERVKREGLPPIEKIMKLFGESVNI